MKIGDPSGHEPTNDNMRKQRMEALLPAWRRNRYWLRIADGTLTSSAPEEYAFTGEEWLVWREVLRVAEPIPPRTHLRGLVVHSAWQGLDIHDLQAQGIVHTIGPRVATRWIRGQATRLGGHSWALRVQRSELGSEAGVGEAVIRKRFREVSEHDDALLAFTPWRGCSETVVALLDEALTNPTGPSLQRLWKLARVLEIDEALVAQLPTVARKALADELLSELNEAIDHLGVTTDARLEFFAEGEGDVPLDLGLREMPLPNSRLTSLLEAERFLTHHHRQIGDHYFDDVAVGFVCVADTFPVAEFLRALPPGRAHLAAIDQLWRRRPELIATYVWHPAFHAEGAFALLQLPQEIRLGSGQSLKLAEEWIELQRLGREQMVLADRSEDWRSVLALGVHDEARAIARKHHGATPYLLEQVPYEDTGLWARAVAAPERTNVFTGLLNEYFHAREQHSEAALLFALRLMAPLREQGQTGAAQQLAHATVDAYTSSLALDIELLSIPAVLPAYGPLLEDLRVSLGGGEADLQWLKWLRPFDLDAYVRQAKRDDQGQLDSRVVNARFHVPRILRAHAEVLVAQATVSSEPGPILDAAIELYVQDREAGLPLQAFSWHALAQTTAHRAPPAEPIFVRIGRLLGRDRGDAARLGRLLAVKPAAHVLAYLLVGLGAGSPLVSSVERPLREALNALLGDDGGVALGQALELANTLHQAGMGRDAERFARRTALIAERLKPHDRQPYLDAANAILAGALAQQGMWPEVLAMDAVVHELAQKLFVDNMRALALMETERYADAERVLDLVLEQDAKNRVALINRTSLHVHAGEWNRAVAAAEHAKALLPSDDRDSVAINEAVAREKLGDRFGAMAALDSVSVAGASRADVRAMKDQLRAGQLSPKQTVRDDASLVHTGQAAADSVEVSKPVPVPEEPAEPIDVAIITALREEYDAIRERLTDPTPAAPGVTRQFPNLYSWVLGSIPKASGQGFHRVVLAVAGQSGNLRSLPTTMRTIDQWSPTFVVFSGIAGGLAKNSLKQGDLVLSQTIWHYEYGKIVEGRFNPRQRDSFHAHNGLLNSALSFESATKEWRDCGRVPPKNPHTPTCMPGVIGSGEKVVDDLEPAFVQAILKARPELQAIEMEAAGAAFAIEQAHEEGKAVGFIMVRGISDMPKPPVSGITKALRRLFGDARPPRDAGTQERDAWKLYASAIAANFIARWIASSWWPSEPRQ